MRTSRHARLTGLLASIDQEIADAKALLIQSIEPAVRGRTRTVLEHLKRDREIVARKANLGEKKS